MNMYTCVCLPIVQGIFDVVAGGIDEHSRVIPASTLHTHVLMHCAQALQLAVTDGQDLKEREEGRGGEGRGKDTQSYTQTMHMYMYMLMYIQFHIEPGHIIIHVQYMYSTCTCSYRELTRDHHCPLTIPAEDGYMTHVLRPHHILGLWHAHTVQRSVVGGRENTTNHHTHMHMHMYSTCTCICILLLLLYMYITCILCTVYITQCVMYMYSVHVHYKHVYVHDRRYLFCCTSKRVTVSLSFSSRCPVPA